MTIGIYEWELPNLKRLADNLSIELKSRPVLVLYDSKSSLCFTNLWNLDYIDCPFSEENACKINNEKPLICQAYPLLIENLFSFSDRKEIGAGDCENAVLLPFEVNKGKSVSAKELFPFLLETYGNCFLGAIKENLILENSHRFFKVIKDLKLVDPAPIPHEMVKAILRGKLEPIGSMELFEIIHPSLGKSYIAKKSK